MKKIKITIFVIALLFAPAFVFAYTIDSSGGDCSTIGTWDASTQTCALTQNVNGTFTINSDNITLDGAGHTIIGTATTTGVYVSYHKNGVIKNLTFSGFSKAVALFRAQNMIVENSIFIGNTTGIRADTIIYGDISANIIRNNTFENNRTAISLNATQGDLVDGNTIKGTLAGDTGITLLANNSISNIIRNNTIEGPGFRGITSNDSDSDVFTGNVIKNFQTGVRFTSCSMGHTFRENTFEGNILGAYFAGSSGTFSRNNFKNNTSNIQNGRSISCGNGTEIFSKPLPDGGNYWSTNTGCLDSNHDNICDTSYSVATSTDNSTNLLVTYFDDFPWVSENGWNLPTTSPLTLSNPTITEDDNLQDAKGVADKTKFTFSVTTTGDPEVKLYIDGTATIFPRSDLGEYTMTATFPKGTHTWYFEANKDGRATTTTETKTFTTGYSNVAFFAGIGGVEVIQTRTYSIYGRSALVSEHTERCEKACSFSCNRREY